jgi:CRP/FNR family cyclic AMP-dependent transcriptional regulator
MFLLGVVWTRRYHLPCCEGLHTLLPYVGLSVNGQLEREKSPPLNAAAISLGRSGSDILFTGGQSETRLQLTNVSHEVVLRHGWLSQAPPAFQATVLNRCRLQRFAQGDAIFSIGDPPGGMFAMVSGGIAISVSPSQQGPYVAHFARPGSWFGEAAAITGQPRRVGLTVTRSTDLLHLPLHSIHEIVAQDPAAWRLFACATVGHLDAAIRAYDDLMIRDPSKRCIAVILRLGGGQQPPPTESSLVEVDLSQDDIATLANVARTTLNMLLRRLEKAGLLELSYRRIRVLAPEALRTILRD